LPTSWFDRAADRARNLKGFLDEKDASTFLKIRSKRQEFRQIRNEIETKRQASQEVRDEIEKIKNEIESIKQESKRIKDELRSATDPAERSEYEKRRERVQQERARLKAELRAVKENERTERIGRKKKKKAAQQELFQLERERRAALEGQTTPDGGGSVPLAEGETGALPDFVIIGGKKCGTTFLYHLVAQHPLVEPAASKELHFFDALFEEGVEWYRQFFPAPRWEDGRRTITGEASPYMAHRLVPMRMAEVVPEARLIALLRNPVERAYSDYQMVARKEREHKTFEEAIGLEEGGDRAGLDDDSEYLTRGVYIDQLLRWTEFFDKEQLLVLKSEDFFENPQDNLQPVLEFLGLPEWDLKAWTLRYRRNKGTYEEGMNPATRRRLEEYFEPHNKRLYDFLGVDLGW
jgi:Sulfotransferase domain